jgi:hypothetical protein
MKKIKTGYILLNRKNKNQPVDVLFLSKDKENTDAGDVQDVTFYWKRPKQLLKKYPFLHAVKAKLKLEISGARE